MRELRERPVLEVEQDDRDPLPHGQLGDGGQQVQIGGGSLVTDGPAATRSSDGRIHSRRADRVASRIATRRTQASGRSYRRPCASARAAA